MKSVLPAFLFACAISRLAAADFTVANINNSGPGSLYQAIADANNTPGPDRILFNIPGAGVHTIDVSQNLLPTVSESLVIDGYSQPGAKPNSLPIGNDAMILIRLDGGAGSATASGLVFEDSNSDYVVRGLCLTGFGEPGSGSFRRGVAITASEVRSAVVAGNFIGVLPDGETPRGNYIGVGHVTHLGGTDPASRNVISGNLTGFAGDTYLTPGTSVYGAVVQGNYIGTNARGTKAIPNVTGIGLETGDDGRSPCTNESLDIDLSNTIIGGTASGAGNLISGNRSGIACGRYFLCGRNQLLTPVRVHGVRIKGNLIGVQSDGVSALPNEAGISVGSGSDHVIGGLEPGAGNVIGFNDKGVLVAGPPTVDHKVSERNQILSNLIYPSRDGIDLDGNGPSPNDLGDSDDGPNKRQNYPVIQNAEIANGSVTINGTLNSIANTQFTLQYFAESINVAAASQTFLGTRTVTTDADGNAQFSATFPLSDTNVSFNMTATSPEGNTSEFSHPAELKNISTRVLVRAGDQAAIAGFIVRKVFPLEVYPMGNVAIRVLGPSLQSVDAPLLDPTLEVYDSKGALIASNDNWRDDRDAYNLEHHGFAPTNNQEAALWMRISEQTYTAVVRGAHDSTGIAVIEVYDISGPTAQFLNISTRGFVGTGDDAMIAGTILEHDAGFTRLVARALGPSLAGAGVTGSLVDPTLELHDSQGAMIASNDDWRDGDADALAAAGLAPSNDRESAILMRLPSGAYTAVVRGKDNATGIGLVELYNLH